MLFFLTLSTHCDYSSNIIGTADWHYLRKFSLTSSQAHGAFEVAFPDFKENESWIAVAKYLYGRDDWRQALLHVTDAAAEIQEADDGNEEDYGPTRPCPIDVYVQQIIPGEDDHPSRAALEFLKKYVGSLQPAVDEDDENCASSDQVEGETVVEDQNEAKSIVDELSAPIRRTILKLLGEHVHEPFRKNPSKQDLIGWLQQPNSSRNYYFYKTTGLRALISAKGLSLGNGRKTAEQMRAILAGTLVPAAAPTSATTATNEALTPKDAATKAILERSFMPHIKNTAKREHCSLGHRLEIPILASWIQDAALPIHKIDVKGAYSAGLAAKQNATYAKDSVDFVLTIKAGEEGGEQEIDTWGFEAKGRVTARTAAEEERGLHYHNNPHIRITDDEVHDEVASLAERFQVLQHAFVYDFKTVVLAISDIQSSLIRSTIIDFSTELKNHFGTVLKDLKESSLEWAYPSTPAVSERRRGQQKKTLVIPEKILQFASSIPTINGAHTLQGTANIWYSLVLLPKPFPSFLRFIPAVYAFWNAVKGGSDTTTKLMDDCIIRIPKAHMTTESVAITRLISILLVSVHRMNQMFSAKEDIDFYSSLVDYRKAASGRSTFHGSILLARQAFCNEIEKIKSDANKENEVPFGSPFARAAAGRRTRQPRPLRQKVKGVIPQRMEYAATLSMKTPTKMKNLIQKGSAPKEIEQMVKTCTGMPVKSDPRKQMRCSHCRNQKTAWYCAGCKQWFCMERRNLSENRKEVCLYALEVRGKQLTFQKSCFHLAHEEAWTQHFKNPKDMEGDVTMLSP